MCVFWPCSVETPFHVLLARMSVQEMVALVMVERPKRRNNQTGF